ncbi:MAG: class I SAM-dependent methyltransferase [Alphaproteobacteria bacterium]
MSGTVSLEMQSMATLAPSAEARFWDRHAKGYARKPVPDEAVYQHKLEVTRRYLRPDMQILEFGCGTGSTALAHAPFVGKVTATDLSGGMIRIAQDKAQAGNVSNVDFQQISFADFDAPDGSFDAVLGMSILHLLVDWEAAIAKAYRLLKPGGVFVSSTGCIGEMNPLLRLALPVARMVRLAPYVKSFTRPGLEHALTSPGFTLSENWQPAKGSSVFIVAVKPA